MRALALLVAVILSVGWNLSQAEGPANTPNVTVKDGPEAFHFWMDVKLKESQAIFEGMTMADFPTIAKSADTLKTLSRVEGFVRRKDPKYRTQLRSFEFAAGEIQRQALQENIEGVVLGFNQLTLSCVHCHKQLRDKTTEDGNPPVR